MSTINYRLSTNDLDIIKHYTGDKAISSLAEKTLIILSKVFGGLHHLPNKQLEKFPYFETYCITYMHMGSLSTYDPGNLSGLVILAHDLAVRFSLAGKANHYIEFMFHEREREGDFSKRHPTIENHAKGWRNSPTYEH